MIAATGTAAAIVVFLAVLLLLRKRRARARSDVRKQSPPSESKFASSTLNSVRNIPGSMNMPISDDVHAEEEDVQKTCTGHNREAEIPAVDALASAPTSDVETRIGRGAPMTFRASTTDIATRETHTHDSPGILMIAQLAALQEEVGRLRELVEAPPQYDS